MPVEERPDAFKRTSRSFHAPGLAVDAAQADIRVDVGPVSRKRHAFFEKPYRIVQLVHLQENLCRHEDDLSAVRMPLDGRTRLGGGFVAALQFGQDAQEPDEALIFAARKSTPTCPGRTSAAMMRRRHLRAFSREPAQSQETAKR